MENLYTIFTSMLCCISITFISDKILKYIIKPNAIYFLMHTILNSYIVYLTYYETFLFLVNPIGQYNYYSPCCIKACSIIIGFHLYHILTEKLDLETAIHHIVTVFITGGSSLFVPTGKSICAITFFMCGLPGGLDYLLLFFGRYNIINKLTEKNINRWLNLLIRMPGMMICNWYILINIYIDNITLNEYLIPVISSNLMLINSIYYCNKTVGNYHVRYYQYIENKST